MSIVGLIPARGGSKGISKKNLALCAGKALIYYTFEAAKNSKLLGEVYLSTDDPEIAQYGEESDIIVPYMRPKELSADNTPMIDVVKHFLNWLRNKNKNVHGILLLQPTSPLRKAHHIDEAISIYENKKPASLISVMEVPHNFSPESLMIEQDGQLTHLKKDKHYLRQKKKNYLARNGPAILIISPKAIDQGRQYASPSIGYKMDRWSSVDIDSKFDLRLAELILENG